ncbi:tetratricopeptide repeat protein [Vulgatibacter incomptus]|uniref:TPR repeat protein n=1 Tax=Vulgatibacter incomptus TaxID=1391653 RepID=A0A0K1PF67_9BACT|nr:tetratricopeptide repeat protein [Vulgatibacter incomptus]AKU92152.1 TPR repeat protein [Vulgatibacter incomptus]
MTERKDDTSEESRGGSESLPAEETLGPPAAPSAPPPLPPRVAARASTSPATSPPTAPGTPPFPSNSTATPPIPSAAPGTPRFPSATSAAPPLPPPPRSAPPPLAPAKAEAGDWLGDLPAPARETPAPVVVADPSASLEAAKAAAEYERQLREKLAQERNRPKGFLRRNALSLSLAVIGLLVAGAGVAAYLLERAATREQEIARYLAAARNGLARDTFAALQASLDALDEALDLDSTNSTALALKAQAAATLAASFDAFDLRAATALASRHATSPEERDALLAARWRLAVTGGNREERRAIEDEILSIPPESAGATLLSLAGAVLLSRDQPLVAVERFNSAILASPGHVPTLVKVGDYYRSRSEHEEAIRYYELALSVSEDHPAALVGAAESHLAFSREPRLLEQALAGLDKLRTSDQVPVGIRLRLAIVRARLRAAVGTRDSAVAELEKVEAGKDSERLVQLAQAYVSIGAADVGLELFRGFDFDASQDPALREAYARLLVAAGRLREAAALSGKPGERPVHLQVGIARFRAGMIAKAHESLHATVLERKLPVEAVVYLGLVDLERGRLDQARKTLERLGTGSRARTTGRWAWARLLRREGKLDEAERALVEAVELDPRSAEPRFELGRLLLERGRHDEALAMLREAVRLNPLRVEGRRALGTAFLEAGNPDAAMDEWEAALELDPEDGAALVDLTGAMLRGGRKDEALARVQAIVRAFPKSAPARRALGEVRLALADPERARQAFSEATQLGSGDAASWAGRGEAELAQGNARAAATSFARALALQPGWAVAEVGLARTDAAQARPAPAEKRLRTLLGRIGSNGKASERAMARSALAAVLLADGKGANDAARQEAEAAVELDGSLGLAHLALAEALDAAGELKPAAQAFSRAAELSPWLADVHLLKARNLLRGGGTTKEAAAALERYLVLAPRGPGVNEARKTLARIGSGG